MLALAVEERSGGQALARKRRVVPMIRGIAQRREHEYIPHGTLCLTAGFNIVTGEVQGLLTPNRPAPVFARFLDEVVASVPEAEEIHFVLDNLNTHWHHDACQVVAAASRIAYDPKLHQTGELRRAFLTSAKKRVRFHFTPKHASWLNQIEIWFSVISRKMLNRESFASLAELETSILQFMEYYNRHLAHPYRWTYTGAPCRD